MMMVAIRGMSVPDGAILPIEPRDRQCLGSCAGLGALPPVREWIAEPPGQLEKQAHRVVLPANEAGCRLRIPPAEEPTTK